MTSTVLHKIVRESPSLAESTRGKYLRDLDSWVTYAGSDPRNWTRYKAQAFYKSLLGRGVRPQTANRVLASIRYASSWWAKKENNPSLDFAVVEKADAQRRQLRRALTEGDATQLLSTCGTEPIDLRDFALLIVGLETGMRLMSLRAMSWETMRMHPTEGYPVAYVPLKGSGEDLYAVPLSDTARAALEPWRAWCKSQKVTRGPVFRGLYRQLARSAKLVYELSDEPLSKPAIYKLVSRRAAKAGVVAHPHILRHTFITWRMQQGLAPYQIAAVTGHKIASLAGMGALGGYVDPARIGGEIRNQTPMWLQMLVRARK